MQLRSYCGNYIRKASQKNSILEKKKSTPAARGTSKNELERKDQNLKGKRDTKVAKKSVTSVTTAVPATSQNSFT